MARMRAWSRYQFNQSINHSITCKVHGEPAEASRDRVGKGRGGDVAGQSSSSCGGRQTGLEFVAPHGAQLEARAARLKVTARQVLAILACNGRYTMNQSINQSINHITNPQGARQGGGGIAGRRAAESEWRGSAEGQALGGATGGAESKLQAARARRSGCCPNPGRASPLQSKQELSRQARRLYPGLIMPEICTLQPNGFTHEDQHSRRGCAASAAAAAVASASLRSQEPLPTQGTTTSRRRVLLHGGTAEGTAGACLGVVVDEGLCEGLAVVVGRGRSVRHVGVGGGGCDACRQGSGGKQQRHTCRHVRAGGGISAACRKGVEAGSSVGKVVLAAPAVQIARKWITVASKHGSTAHSCGGAACSGRR